MCACEGGRAEGLLVDSFSLRCRFVVHTQSAVLLLGTVDVFKLLILYMQAHNTPNL